MILSVNNLFFECLMPISSEGGWLFGVFCDSKMSLAWDW